MKRKPGRALVSLLLFALLSGVLLTGCWDRRELEDRTSVVALAVDRMESKSGTSLVKVSVQIPIPIKIAGAGGAAAGAGGKEAVKVMSGTGYSMASAMENIQQRLNQELFYGHTRVIAVSERIAREDMQGIVDTLRRSPQMRRLLWLVVTPGEAANLLRVDPKLEQIPIVYVMELIENGARAGRVPEITLGRWYIEHSSKGIEPSAITIVANKNEVRWQGTSLFRGDRFVGTIDEHESWVLLQVRDHEIGGDITIACPGESAKDSGKYITAHPKRVHVKTKVDPYQDTYRMSSTVLVEVDVVESMCELDYSQRATYVKVQNGLRDELNRRAVKLIEDCQKKYRVDVFGMGNKIRSKYLERFDAMNWQEEFPKAKIEVIYEVKIRRGGMKMQ